MEMGSEREFTHITWVKNHIWLSKQPVDPEDQGPQLTVFKTADQKKGWGKEAMGEH